MSTWWSDDGNLCTLTQFFVFFVRDRPHADSRCQRGGRDGSLRASTVRIAASLTPNIVDHDDDLDCHSKNGQLSTSPGLWPWVQRMVQEATLLTRGVVGNMHCQRRAIRYWPSWVRSGWVNQRRIRSARRQDVTADVISEMRSPGGTPLKVTSGRVLRGLAVVTVAVLTVCLWTAPLRRTGWWVAVAVVAHAMVCLRREITRGEQHCEISRSEDSRWEFPGVIELAVTGGFVALAVWLVMTTGLRQACQLSLFDNVYFPYLRGDERAYGWRILILYTGVAAASAYLCVRWQVRFDGSRHDRSVDWTPPAEVEPNATETPSAGKGSRLAFLPFAVLLVFFQSVRFSTEVEWDRIGNLVLDCLRWAVAITLVVSARSIWMHRDRDDIAGTRKQEAWIVTVLIVAAATPVAFNLLASQPYSKSAETSVFLLSFFLAGLTAFVWYWKRKSDSAWPTAIIAAALVAVSIVPPSKLVAFGVGPQTARRQQVRMSISVVGTPSDLEVFANGVSLGKAPVDISVSKLLKIGRSSADFQADVLKNVPPIYKTRNDRFELAHRRSWEQHTSIRLGDGASRVYLELRHNGSPVHNSVWFSKRSRDRDSVVQLAWSSPQWQIEMGRLIDIARLRDYNVDAAWCEAFASYGDRGWVRIEQESDRDPQLRGVQDAVVRHVFAVTEGMTPKAAWSCLQRIADSTAKVPYLADSYRGRAVELLVGSLDENQLADKVVELLRVENPAILKWTMRESDSTATSRFSTGQQRSHISDADSMKVFWHAAAALDRLLNADGERGNPFELRVVPELIRHYLLNGKRRHEALYRAKSLGGAEFDSFLLRHDWTAEVKTPANRYEIDVATTSWFGVLCINRWLHELLHLDSDAGRRFRQENEAMILELAERSLADPPKKKLSESDRAFNMLAGILTMQLRSGKDLPEHLDFLFLDPPVDGEMSLAMKFWPVFCRCVDETRMLKDNQKLTPKIAYLCRMWPEPSDEMLVNLVVDHMGHVSYYAATMKPFLREPLDDETRFQLLEQIKVAVAAAAAAKATADGTSNPEEAGERWRRCFREYQMRLDCPQAADLVSRNYIDTWSEETLKDRLGSATLFKGKGHLVTTFAQAERADFRLAATRGILNVPLPSRTKLLETLLDDEDEAVASRAREVRKELDSLLVSELPYRDPAAVPLASVLNR